MGSRPFVMAVLVLALAGGSYAAGPARAADVPDSATLRARIATAEGPAPTNFQETIVGSGVLGDTREMLFRRAADTRLVFDRGPIHTESGVYKGERWHQDANGLTIVDEPLPGNAVRDTITTTVRHVSNPVDAYVITSLNVREQGTREYIDPNTSLPIRREQVGPFGTLTTSFERYAKFGNRTLAAHWTVTTAKGATMTYDRTAYVADGVTEADVAEPPIKRELVAFPEGSNREEIPTKFYDGDIFVHVTIGSRTVDLRLSSGAAGIALEAGTAHELGLTFFNETTALRSDQGTYDRYRAIVPSMQIGALQMRDVVINVLPHPMEMRPGIAKVVGELGFDFLATLGVTIDYEHGHAYALRAGSYAPPQGPYVNALPVRLSTQVAMASATFNGNAAERVVVDTGFNGSILLFDTFLRRYPTVIRGGGDDRLFRTFAGPIRAYEYDLDLVLGRARFQGATGYGTTNPSDNRGGADAVVGADFLRAYTVTLDFPNGEVYLVPNTRGMRGIGTGAR